VTNGWPTCFLLALAMTACAPGSTGGTSSTDSTHTSTNDASTASGGGSSTGVDDNGCGGVTLPGGREPDVSGVVVSLEDQPNGVLFEWVFLWDGPNNCSGLDNAHCSPGGLTWEVHLAPPMEPGIYCDWEVSGDCLWSGQDWCSDCEVEHATIELYEVTDTCVAGYAEFSSIIPAAYGDLGNAYFLVPRCDPLPTADSPHSVDAGPCPSDDGTDTATGGS